MARRRDRLLLGMRATGSVVRAFRWLRSRSHVTVRLQMIATGMATAQIVRAQLGADMETCGDDPTDATAGVLHFIHPFGRRSCRLCPFNALVYAYVAPSLLVHPSTESATATTSSSWFANSVCNR